MCLWEAAAGAKVQKQTKIDKKKKINSIKV
jgi:hypothetical protein